MWRLRFSLRTLVVFVALLGVYFGPLWVLTKEYGVPEAPSPQENRLCVYATSPAPLIVQMDLTVGYVIDGVVITPFGPTQRRYFLWTGVNRVKLPYARQLSAAESSWVLVRSKGKRMTRTLGFAGT